MATETTLPWEKSPHPVRIGVLGDIILDEYLAGKVSRISPEAPVPIHHVHKTTHVAGGAANAARNIQMVGGEACIFSVVGEDLAGDQLTQLLIQDEINTDNVIQVKDRPTNRKTRVTANHQQIVRIDWERVHPIGKEQEAALLHSFQQAKLDAVLLSDYGKGVLSDDFLQQLIATAREKKVKVLVDPKGKDFSKYLGAFLVTPNKAEALGALGWDEDGDHDPLAIATQLRERFQLSNVLVTLGPKGMILASEDKKVHGTYLPAIAKEVYDVSGAGDTVAAMMALSLAAKAPLPQAMDIATKAAATVVQKWGTQPILKSELIRALRADQQPAPVENFANKFVSLKELKQRMGALAPDKVTVFTNGCFDLIHKGHVTYLEQARSLGDVLIVAINSDASVQRLKGASRPIVNQDNRAMVLCALRSVDYVLTFDQDTPYELIKALNPDVLVKGGDWAVADIVGNDVVSKNGGKVLSIPYVEGQSTTAIVDRIRLQ